MMMLTQDQLESKFITASREAAQHVGPKLLKLEPELYNTKWFDYRFDDEGPVHPLHASNMFAVAYWEAYQDYYKRRIDADTSKGIFPLKSKRIVECSQAQITGIWTARQTADSFGVKYDFWCWKAMKYIEERNWAILPRPQHLYARNSKASGMKGYVSLVDYILQEWRTHLLSNLVCAESPFYRVIDEEPPYHPYQLAHMRYLLEKVKESANKEMLLATIVFDKGLLTPSIVEAAYPETGADLIRRAERLHKIFN